MRFDGFENVGPPRRKEVTLLVAHSAHRRAQRQWSSRSEAENRADGLSRRMTTERTVIRGTWPEGERNSQP